MKLFRSRNGFSYVFVLNAILSSVLTLSSQKAFCWGAKGHEIIAAAGAHLTGNQFFVGNAQTITQLSTVPDRVWKATNYQYESPNHWFQGDAYTSSVGVGSLSQFPRDYAQAVAKMGEATIVKNGTGPWRVKQFYDLALQAMQKGDAQSAIIYVGVMSHYVGDLSQPLHVSENFDGEQTGQKGIHKFFETDNIKDETAIAQQVLAQAQKLLQNQSYVAQVDQSLLDFNFAEIERALMFRDKILSIDKQFGRQGQGAQMQLQLAISRMADGAATYAVLLNHLWQASQGHVSPVRITVPDPAWVVPNFTSAAQYVSEIQRSCPATADADDCAL